MKRVEFKNGQAGVPVRINPDDVSYVGQDPDNEELCIVAFSGGQTLHVQGTGLEPPQLRLC